MKRFLTYLGRYKVYSVLAPLFKCLEACFELLIPIVVARMIDVGIAGGDLAYIFRMGGLLVLLGIIGLVCSITAQYFSADVAVKIGTSLRSDLCSHIFGLGFEELDRLGTSTMLTRMTSDINQIQTGVNMFLRLFMRSPFIVFGAAVMAFTVDLRGALVFAVTVPLLCLVVFCILLGTMPLYRRVQAQLDSVMRSTRENLLGVRVVRAFGMEEREMRSFQAENDRLRSLQIFVGKLSALLNPATIVIANLAIVVLLYTGGRQVNAGTLTQGSLVALVNYMSLILTELVKFANLVIVISKAIACMNRVNAVFEVQSPIETSDRFGEKQETCDGTPLGKKPGTDGEAVSEMKEKDREYRVKTDGGVPSVSFDKVSFAYAGAQEESLQGITFCAKSGETIGVIGGTGAGKTTLVNLIPRFYEVSQGSVTVKGKDVRNWDLSALRGKIGIVPQKALLFSGTIRDNMKWGAPDATDEEILHAIRVAQADDVLEKKKEGLDFVLEQFGQNLSGGQRQRLTIARAVVRKPEILILDDAASALDFATDAALRRALREETDGMTVFLISQRVSAVRSADRILVLDDGRQAGFDTHAALLRDCEAYQEICRSQMSEAEYHAELQNAQNACNACREEFGGDCMELCREFVKKTGLCSGNAAKGVSR